MIGLECHSDAVFHMTQQRLLVTHKAFSDRLMHVATWHCQTPESKLTKFGEEMSIGQTHNHAKFCSDPIRSARDIRDQKFVLPKKVE